MTKFSAVLLLLMLPGALANASALTETFASRANLATEGAVWNQGLGKVHPGLRVEDYEPASTPISVDVGDGFHGSFDIATYASFSKNGDISGNKIRLDTSDFKILRVTYFKLEPGWVLEPTGPYPLVIYSQSDVIIQGTIDCKGADGGNATNAVAGQGAIGRCGGGDGGNGGAIGASGSDGISLLSPVTPGLKGNFNPGAATPGVGGGGGGGWNTTSPPTDGNPVNGFGGGAGTSISDPEFFDITPGSIGGGGAGGGGGAASTFAGGRPGAGGAAGGGAVIIHAVRNVDLGTSPTSLTGLIDVNGGIGGSTGHQAGAGGGGGGGSVKIFAGGTLNIYNTDGLGASHANGGLGGSNLLANNGGVGGMGRNWLVGNVYNGVGFYTPGEEAPVDPLTAIVRFNPASQSVVSRVFDLAGNFSQIQSLTLAPVSTDFTFEVAGSSDNFLRDDTGFTQNVNLISGKRYLKFRITLAGGNVNLPAMVDEASINYVMGLREEFNLQSAGCGRVESPNGPTNGWFFVLIFGFLVFLRSRNRTFNPF